MGYLVVITPEEGRTGFLSFGALAPSRGQGTYYPNPSHGRVAARRWLLKHPGGKAEMIDYKTRQTVEVF